MEVISICAIILSPILAVLITLWHQDRTQKKNTQVNTYLTLIAFRDVSPHSGGYGAFVNALNTIDVVFHGNMKIIKLWHEYYDLLTQETKNQQTNDLKKIELLSAIGKHLGYDQLQQVDISKFYSPELWAKDFQEKKELDNRVKEAFSLFGDKEKLLEFISTINSSKDISEKP